MSYFEHHVFFCCNQRDDGRPSCNDKGTAHMRHYAKRLIKELEAAGPGEVALNTAGVPAIATD